MPPRCSPRSTSLSLLDLLVHGALTLAVATPALAGDPCGASHAEEQLVVVPAPAPSDRLATAVAIDGQRLALGAIETNGAGAVDGPGSVWVFTWGGQSWEDPVAVQAAGGQDGDRFGAAIALDGDLLVVGAPSADAFGIDDAGAVTVFQHAGSSWVEVATLTSPTPGSWQGFGSAVAVDGGRVLVGEPGADGTAALFDLSGGPSLESTLGPPPGIDFASEYGSAVALVGDVAVIGASGHDLASYDSGSAWVWRRDGGLWTQTQMIAPSDGTVLTAFGRALDFDGQTLVVGADTERPYVYAWDGAAFGAEGRLEGCGAPGTSLGDAVAVDGDRCVVSSESDGSATVFARIGSAWVAAGRLEPSTTQFADGYGAAAGLHGDTVVVGAPRRDGTVSDQGAAFVHAAPAVGPWVDLPGATGDATLTGAGPLTGGSAGTLHVAGAPPTASAGLVLGFSELLAPFHGGTLVPAPDIVLVGLVTSGGGALTLPFTWPTGVPAGFTTWMQTWVADGTPSGWTATNAIAAIAAP